MDRRTFARLLPFVGLSGLFSLDFKSKPKTAMDIIKPKRLKKGDTIGLIAPASPVSEKGYSRAMKNLTDLGFKYKTGSALMHKYGYLAGDDKSRIDDIHTMFADPEVDAIWCIRGGYGTTRILDELDYSLIKENPKVFIGYSDITALHQAIFVNTGLISFHGPLAGSELTDYSRRSFESILKNNETIIKPYKYDSRKDPEHYKPEVIIPGQMQGILTGGNLSLIASLAGTIYQLDTMDKIVIMEDVDEKPYKIDRMLTQIINSSGLNGAKGILLGIFDKCHPKPEDKNSLTLMETIRDRLGNLDIPVYYGFSFGHIKNNCTIPFGIMAKFDTDRQQIKLMEKALL